MMFSIPRTSVLAQRLNHHMTKVLASTYSKKPTLTLYTKEVCPLCDDAKEVLQPFMDQVHFEQVDIEAEGNEEWYDKYKYEIPVFHLNGKHLMRHKVNTSLLQRKLKELKDG